MSPHVTSLKKVGDKTKGVNPVGDEGNRSPPYDAGGDEYIIVPSLPFYHSVFLPHSLSVISANKVH